ncbi:DUF4349 domain-containing protein [Sphingomonas sp. HMP6]|uniref:DUF4349 domain-containing protein n=1 Tax=Sphingomonas sp. HMP6 TaxID=1517551 RepID=UPI001596799F|nr:DUF4349 domain-containing protein [Sphingomonas sp. HMP6]
MRYPLRTSLLLCLSLVACSKSSSDGGDASHYAPSARVEKLDTFDVVEAGAANAAPLQSPQIAYSYELSYLLADAQLADVQAKQVALCTDLGPAKCQVAKTSISNAGRGAGASGETKLLVDARIAIVFQKQLDKVVTAVGGQLSDRSTTAEDITKQVIDTDARVRAKQILADRLTKLIAESNGKVSDLVAAEQAFATTQEELDAARSLQASLLQRVAMSDITIGYATRESNSMWAPVRRSLGAVGDSLGGSIAALVTFVVVALPWVVMLSLLAWVLRRIGWRWPFRRRLRGMARDEAPS